MSLEPHQQSHTFLVTIDGCTEEEAEQVISERTLYDEDYGFDYTISTEKHQALNLSRVTRITVVGDAGKGLLFEDYHAYEHPHGPELSLQDEGRTLKILPTRG